LRHSKVCHFVGIGEWSLSCGEEEDISELKIAAFVFGRVDIECASHYEVGRDEKTCPKAKLSNLVAVLEETNAIIWVFLQLQILDDIV
jgi:hypothetical protein